jgi:tetratricopeptide (TPR) repeat protein
MPRATATHATLTLPTYLIGPPDPNPALHREGVWAIYPYTMLDDIGHEVVERTYRAVVLENEHIRVTILPELGGRIHSIFDKNAGQEALYTNHVVKPALVAQRGAWLAGGLEWNYPAGHHCNTVSPVSGAAREYGEGSAACTVGVHDDGSATCTVGARDHTTRARWSVEISLRQDSTRVDTTVRVVNDRPLATRLYFWQNAAVRAPRNLQLVYPTVRAQSGGVEVRYPITEDGRDLSRYTTHQYLNDVFCLGSMECFFGCYYPDDDIGVVHCASPREVPGKKYFTWGNAPSGMIWADLLSDGDGPYCEIQAGRFQTQSVWEFLAPRAEETWQESWWPIHAIGGFQWATGGLALRFEADGALLHLGLCAAFRYSEASVRVYRDGEVIWSREATLAPESPLREDLPLLGPIEAHRIVVEWDGGTALDYVGGQAPRTSDPLADRLLAEIEPLDETTPLGLLRAGVRFEKQTDYVNARDRYARALEADPNLTDARVGLASIALRSGLYAEAEERARAVVVSDPDRAGARYVLALALRELGRAEEAAGHLELLRSHPVFAASSVVALAETGLANGNPHAARALEWIRRASAETDVRSYCIESAAERHGRDPAPRQVPSWLTDRADPTAVLLWIEAWLSGDEVPLRRITLGLPQEYLEAAWDYAACGFYDDAIRVVRKGIEDGPGVPETLCTGPGRSLHPMLYYTLGYLLHREGKEGEALEQLPVAAALPPDTVCPHRVEELRVLEWALEATPGDARASLYLGNLLWHLGRRDEALAQWHRACHLDPGLAIAHRNMAVAVTRAGLHEKAAECYTRAIEANPEDYRYYRDRDDVLRTLRTSPEERLAGLEAAPEATRARQDLAWRIAALRTVVGDYETAVRVLDTHTFCPWEGAVAMRRVYTDALSARGRQRLRAGDLPGAREDFERSLEYPLHIGVGQLPEPGEVRELYWAARARHRTGDDAGAIEALARALRETHPSASVGRCYQALANRLAAELGASGGNVPIDEEGLLSECREAAEAKPEDAETALALAMALELAGDTAGAERELSRARALNPELVEARLSRE